MIDFIIFANLTLLIPHLIIKKLRNKNQSLNISSQLLLLLGPIYHILLYQLSSFVGLNRYYLNLIFLIGLLFLIITIFILIKSDKPLLIVKFKSWVMGKRIRILGVVFIVASISLQHFIFFDSRFSDLLGLSILSKENVDNNPSYYPTGILSFLAFFTFRSNGLNQFEINHILLLSYVFMIFIVLFIINFLRLYYDFNKILMILVLILGLPSPLSYALIFPSSTQILLIVILFMCVTLIKYNLDIPKKYFIIITILMSAGSISSLHIYAPVTLFLALSILIVSKFSKNSWKLILIYCTAPSISVLYFLYKSSLVEILNVILPSETSKNLIDLGQELLNEFNFSLKYSLNFYFIFFPIIFTIIFLFFRKYKKLNINSNFLLLSGAFCLVSILFGFFEVNFFRGRLIWFLQLYISIFIVEFFQANNKSNKS
jgi:hypothetical protein